MTTKILVETAGPVTTLIINRPQARNALDNGPRVGWRHAQAFEADSEAQVAVLTGAGGSFCAGADLKNWVRHRLFPWARSGEGPLRAACRRSPPSRAMRRGWACAVLRYPHRRRHGRVRRVLASMGRADERRHHGAPAAHHRPGPRAHVLLTGRAVGADEAIAMGLATRKVARGTTRLEAEKLARQIAGFPPIAMISDRQSAYESFDRDQAAAVRREMELSLAARRQESQKGAARFAKGEGRHGKFERQ
jgi:enoyl-CoA hydratase